MSSFGRSCRCSHIKVTGHRCGSPALHGDDLCYFHARLIGRIRARIDNVISPVAQLENEEAVQVSLMTVIDSILKGTLELKRAQLIVRALSIAQRNARHTHFHSCTSDMVRHVPEQPALATAPSASEVCPERSEEPALSLSKGPTVPAASSVRTAGKAKPRASCEKPCHSSPASAGEESALAPPGTDASAPFTPAQQREHDEINRALAGAERGNLEDFKTILGVAGLLDADGHL
jgi:hypothetical protein